MNIFRSKVKKSQLAETIIGSPKALLSKLVDDDADKIEVTLFDCHGQQHFGNPIKIDSENKYLLLLSTGKDEADSALSFISLDSVISLKVHNPAKHLKTLTGRDLEQAPQLKEDREIDIEDYALEVKNILKKSYSINFDIKLVDTGASPKSKNHQKILIDTVKSIITEIAKDSYSAELISAIDTINIVQSSEKQLSIKRRNSAIHIRADLEQQLPSKLPELIEDGISRAL